MADPSGGSRVCGAKTRSGGTCKKAPCPGMNRCRNHGGASPVGPASKAYKHGRYSKLLPAELRKNYDAMRKDENLLSLMDENALLAVRISEVVSGLQEKSGGEVFREISQAWTDLKAATLGNGDIHACQAKLESLIRDGVGKEKSWLELRELLQERASLAKAEWTRLSQLNSFITVAQALTLVTAIADAVKRHVREPTVLAAVTAEIMVLIGRPTETPANVDTASEIKGQINS